MRAHTASVALVLALCVSGSPEAVGEDSLRMIALLDGRGSNESITTPDESVVAFSTTGPAPVFLLADSRLSTVLCVEDALPPDSCAPSRLSNEVIVTFLIDKFMILSVPNLEIQRTLPLDPERLHDLALMLCPFEAGWLAVGHDGELTKIESGPWRLTASVRSVTKRCRGAATDEKTRTAVICGDGMFAEVFDLDRMKSRARVRLGSQVGYGVCAGDGTAWIATEDGQILHFDIASATVVGRTDLTAERNAVSVRMDLAPSGRYLTASACRRQADESWLTAVRVFRVEKAGLTEVASVRARLRNPINDLTIMEKSRIVIVSSAEGASAWHYQVSADAAATTPDGVPWLAIIPTLLVVAAVCVLARRLVLAQRSSETV